MIGSRSLMRTVASRKLSRALLRAPDESAAKVLTTDAVEPDLQQYILTFSLPFYYKCDHFCSLLAPHTECCEPGPNAERQKSSSHLFQTKTSWGVGWVRWVSMRNGEDTQRSSSGMHSQHWPTRHNIRHKYHFALIILFVWQWKVGTNISILALMPTSDVNPIVYFPVCRIKKTKNNKNPCRCFVFLRRCSVSYSPLWRHQRPLTEASSKAFSVEEPSLWTGRTSVSTKRPFHPFIFNITLLIALPRSNVSFLSLLVGETAAGKASRSLAQHIPGPGSMEGMKGAASGVVGELARARIALDERGQKLGELEERTAAMMASAESFSKHAHDVRTCRLFDHLKCRFQFPDSPFSLLSPSDDAEI